MHDAAETSEARRGENEYFANFVCLNERGKIQAKIINEFIIKHGMKVGNVISSPSCRARQTAKIGFNKLDAENKLLVYKGVFTQDYKKWQENLRKLLLNIPIQNEKNTVITAHGSTIFKNLFDNKKELEGIDIPRKVNEGGFYVISRNNGQLIFEHQFTKFTDFSTFIHNRN